MGNHTPAPTLHRNTSGMATYHVFLYRPKVDPSPDYPIYIRLLKKGSATNERYLALLRDMSKQAIHQWEVKAWNGIDALGVVMLDMHDQIQGHE